jgi:hypothetical protein
MRAGRGAPGRSWLVAATAAVALAGCTSVPHASRERDAEAKEFITHPGSSTLYVMRDDFPVGSGHMRDSVLYANGRLIGATLSRTYFRIDLRPGAQLLHGDGFDQGRLKLDTLSGEIYFVSLTVANGSSHFTVLEPEDAKRRLLRCCVLLENWTPGQRPLLR